MKICNSLGYQILNVPSKIKLLVLQGKVAVLFAVRKYKTSNVVFRDIVLRIYQGVTDFQNVIKVLQ